MRAFFLQRDTHQIHAGLAPSRSFACAHDMQPPPTLLRRLPEANASPKLTRCAAALISRSAKVARRSPDPSEWRRHPSASAPLDLPSGAVGMGARLGRHSERRAAAAEAYADDETLAALFCLDESGSPVRRRSMRPTALAQRLARWTRDRGRGSRTRKARTSWAQGRESRRFVMMVPSSPPPGKRSSMARGCVRGETGLNALPDERPSMPYDLNDPKDRERAWKDYLWKDHGILRQKFHNMHEVGGGMWRANQPSPERLEQLAADHPTPQPLIAFSGERPPLHQELDQLYRSLLNA